MFCRTCERMFDNDEESCPFDGSRLEPEDSTQRSLPAASLGPGALVGGYRLEARIGAGAMGVVYRAVHPIIGRQVAIKLLSQARSLDRAALGRFIKEARAVNKIQHADILEIFDFGHLPDGRAYLVMEFVDGLSLGQFLEQWGRLEVSHALSVLRQVAGALEAAHAHGIVHRDLKPDNILLRRGEGSQFNRVKLVDFGVAKFLAPLPGAGEGNTLQTETGALVGTPYYMSPEQCEGERVDHRSDIYALGVVAFELLTGQRPFRGRRLTEILVRHVTEQPPLPSQLVSTLPVSVDAVLLRALEKDPARRYARATELVAELEQAFRSGYEERASLAGSEESLPPRREVVTVHLSPVPETTPDMVGSGGGPDERSSRASFIQSPPSFASQPDAPPGDAPASLASTQGPRASLWTWGLVAAGVAALALGALLFFVLTDRHTVVTASPPAPARVSRGPALLRLVTTPPGAEITLDGTTLAAVTPAELPLPRGRQTVLLELKVPGYQEFSQDISYHPGQEIPLTITLVPRPSTGSIRIESVPPGARIYLDQESTGHLTPFTIQDLAAERPHRLSLHLAGYDGFTEEIRVEAGQETPIEVWLKRATERHVSPPRSSAPPSLPRTSVSTMSPAAPVDPPATSPAVLTLATVPAGASVYIDGLKRGDVPLSLSVESGIHEVKLLHRGFPTTASTRVTLQPGERRTLEWDFTERRWTSR